MKRSVRIGITGKLGSGKSVLIGLMESRGCTVLRTDELAREMMEHDAELRRELIQILGTKAYAGDKLDRAYVASRIFEEASLLQRVEAVVHPAVTMEVEKIFALQPSGIVAVESALILRTRFSEIFDYIVLVESPSEKSIERVVREGRMTKSDAESRLREQEIADNRRSEADFIVENASTKEAFESQCATLMDLIEAIAKRELPEIALHSTASVEAERKKADGHIKKMQE